MRGLAMMKAVKTCMICIFLALKRMAGMAWAGHDRDIRAKGKAHVAL